MIRVALLVFLSLAVVGCSSMPSGPEFSGLEATASPSEGTLYIYRPDAYYGKAITYPVLLNGNKIADLGTQGYFPLTVEPGEYRIQPDTDSIDHELRFSVTAGEVQFLRLKVNRKPAICFCTSLEFEEVDRPYALRELPRTRRETERVYGYQP